VRLPLFIAPADPVDAAVLALEPLDTHRSGGAVSAEAGHLAERTGREVCARFRAPSRAGRRWSLPRAARRSLMLRKPRVECVTWDPDA
jgi:hypothetical protein